MTATTTPFQPTLSRFSGPALDHAINRRMAGGMTLAAILDEIRVLFPGQGQDHDAGTLNHQVRQEMRRRGLSVPTRRPAIPARRFGVEIECKGLDSYYACRALTAAGISAVDEGYNHRTPDGYWKCTYDGSLRGTSCEVVSPPMTDVDEVARVMKVLRQAGAKVDRECGLHVHHEATDLDGEQLARVVELWALVQHDIDRLVSRSRRGRQSYLGPLPTREVESYAARFRSAVRADMTPTEKKRAAAAAGIGGRPGERYRHLNVHSFGNYGTLEIRQHQGTLNGRKAAEWIRLGQAILHAAKTGVTLNPGALLDDLVGAGMTSRTRTYWNDRATSLAA